MRTNRAAMISRRVCRFALLFCFIAGSAGMADSASAQPQVDGVFTANDVSLELPYVYVWPEKEGFYSPGDPSWIILFVERELAQQEIGELPWDAAWVEVRVTRTTEFSDQPELQVYSQSVKLSADAGGNLSGGTYPQLELEGLDSSTVSGRIWHTETQELFDDTYHYDFTFSAVLSDPHAPIGDVLPADGGEPGQAYLTWVSTIQSGDVDKLKSIVPPEMVEQLEAVSPEEVSAEIEFMQSMTPIDVRVIGGSSDGETAILQVEGVLDGETLPMEVTMTRMGEHWIPTATSM